MSAEDSFAHHVTRLGALADPVRRALYRFVVAQRDAVSRDQAADGVDVPRHTAKHHLDRLVDAGLLVTEFRRLTGRTGPGAGRPSKLYLRAERELAVSLPHRRYDLAGHVLADAVERSLAGTPLPTAVREAATDAGGAAARGAAAPDRDAGELEHLAGVLGHFGYEPRLDGDLLLDNCPYDRLASEHPDLVCDMNLAFVGAVVEGAGCSDTVAHPDRAEGRCCVRLRTATQREE